MSKRLGELYALGDEVEILFRQGEWNGWARGLVVGFQTPGLWVRLGNGNGSAWFVTNTRRIRPVSVVEPDEE